ncbi:MAG TPA: ATP-binding cassette domain-containing protein [Ferruginibacter sp.]|jgi:ATP-binding cassette subfamily F protein 3|nr:ATP-binding cassette domain-containing protein [Chitinophagaceae bacterium]MBP6372568.1 ATP-binding cassette domain-containing protein [Ferruginibacter sp.]MBK8928836.1 ATP-binding cassette domain-containing protein [Chitinophagaceae bacterium]MBP6987347.1 ATP-binding cassette domain-containing protein [Ferruginibacter sp.]MBP7718613.1 ATP-binding cassette domain-containing protein [Ferruginibacter sp.]
MLLGLQDVTFEFGARTIVENATWHIQPNERIGLIGYNGTGKSTLLKVLTHQFSPSKGTVEKGRETTVGFLHQDLLGFDTEDSILNVALGAFEKVKELEHKIEVMGEELSKTGDEKLAHDYADLLHQMEVLDGYSIHHRTEEILQGLGFANADLQKPYKNFSGGWRMRVLLAKMILQSPDVLLLDEPTNHLDLPSIEWLEKYLMHYPGAVVVVSHDRFFLDRMVTKIVELYQLQLHFYTGNYSFYETEKAMRIDLQKKAFDNQQDYIRQQERFVERFKAKASKAAQAQSIMKRLDKLDRIEDVSLERPNMKINFSVEKQPGKIICSLKKISKHFKEINIVENASAEIDRGDKIALIGANGKGKSTLLRIISGAEPFNGEREWGHNVVESFYAQHQLEALHLENNLLEEMQTTRSGKTELELRSLLGAFLFSGDNVDKKIKVLSGGERARVALAKTITSKANFLMLDEPTNHLDIHSVDLLVEALNKYEGSLILVSHDRYFISRLANKIWEIDDHKIIEFKGSYAEWEDWKQRREAEQKNKKKEIETPKEVKKQPENNPPNQDQKKEVQQLKSKFKKLEEKIAKQQQETNRLEQALSNPEIYAETQKFTAAENLYKNAQKELEKLNGEYEGIFEQIMKIEEGQ